MRKAMILIVHGSRVSKTAVELVDMVKKMNEMSAEHTTYFPAFMQLQSPSLNESIKTAIEQSFELIEVVPLFLLAGKHVLNDIPRMVEESKKLFPEVSIKLRDHIGAADSFLNAIINL